jgi:hypothetical protein
MKRGFSFFRTVFLSFLILITLASCDRIPSSILVATAPANVLPAPSPAFLTLPTKSTKNLFSDPYGHPIFYAGDIINAGSGILVVSGWEILPMQGSLKPDLGNKFIAIDIVIVNLDSSAVSISSLMQITLRDGAGSLYNINYLATEMLKGGTLDGELSPGERVRGRLGFQVPEDVTGLQLIFDANIFGVGKVYVDLGENPVVFGSPPPIVGEVWQPAYNLGDLIVTGWLALTVNSVAYPDAGNIEPPSDGFMYLVLDLTLENKGAIPVNLSSLSQMWVKDATGRKYTLDLQAMSVLELSSLDGNLAGGETKRGQVGFQVPEDAVNCIFVFDGDRFNPGKVFIIIPS